MSLIVVSVSAVTAEDQEKSGREEEKLAIGLHMEAKSVRAPKEEVDAIFSVDLLSMGCVSESE